MANLLVVIDDVAQVVAAAVVRLTHRHAVVRQVDIAVVAEDWRRRADGLARACLYYFFRGRDLHFGMVTGLGGGKSALLAEDAGQMASEWLRRGRGRDRNVEGASKKA